MAFGFSVAAQRAPVGKGLYARDNDWYPSRSPAQYAKALGCDFIALLNHDTPDHQLREAQQLGLDVYLYQLPGWWTPDRWRRTLGELSDRAARFGLRGFIADPETAPLWHAGRGEVEPFAYALRDAAARLPSVGVTSFPSWPYMKTLATIGAPSGLWGSPQLYGVHTPCNPEEVCRQRGVGWERAFGMPLVASVAAARGRGRIVAATTGKLWGRDPAQQAYYQSVFAGARAAIFWAGQVADGRIQPEIGSPGFEVMRRWRVGAVLDDGARLPHVAQRPGAAGGGLAAFFLLGGLGAAFAAAKARG